MSGGTSAGGMGLSATAEAAKTAIDRLTFFGDAVVAIAMTLLASIALVTGIRRRAARAGRGT